MSNSFRILRMLLIDKHLQWFLLRLFFSQQTIQTHNVDWSLEWLVSSTSTLALRTAAWEVVDLHCPLFLKVHRIWWPNLPAACWRFGICSCQIHPKRRLLHKLLHGQSIPLPSVCFEIEDKSMKTSYTKHSAIQRYLISVSVNPIYIMHYHIVHHSQR